MNWIIYTILAIFLFTATNLLQRLLATESKNPRVLSLLFTLYSAILAWFVLLISGDIKNLVLPTAPIAWVYMLIACLFWGLYERLRFITANLLDASILATVSTVSIVIAFIISIFLYKEPFTIEKILGLLLIIGSIALVSFSKQAKVSIKGIYISVIASILLGIAWSLDKVGAQYFNATTYSVLVWTLPMIVIYFPYIKIKDLVIEAKLGTWKIFLFALLIYFAYIAQLQAQVLGEATRVIPLVQLFVITTTISGIVILKERDDIPKKIIAGVLAVIGAALLL